MASEDDNYGSLLVKGTPVAELKVNDIKKELDKRGLSKAGSKTQMLERLKAQLLLEKLQQDAAQSSGDELEGKVPNMALQQESAGQSEFVRQYLEQQQKNLERQMEVKKQVEEERKRKSADESSADETATPQDSSKPTIDPEVTSPKKFKDDNSNAPATEESKMPRPARKSSRNVSKGENGQDSGVVKEKSRSPSPEKESLRERTRSGSSSSSRSATPDAASIRGRSTRGARGGRRGGKRGRGRQQVRKESRSSSHSSTEEEIMPKKRNRRSTNSRSSRSRSRSPPQKTSPELTPATRRSSRRISTAKTPPETEVAIDLTPAEPIQKTKESVFKNEDKDSIEKPGDEESKSSDVTDTKTANVKEVRRSVEVLEPAAGTIKTIEIADMTNESGNGKTSQDAPSNGEAENGNENSEEKGGVSSLVRSKENAEPPSEPEKFMEPESKHKEIAKVGKERAKSDPQQSDKAQGPHDSTATTDRIPKDRVAVHESSKQSKEDEIKEVSKRRRSGSSSSSSNSPSPQRKKEIKRGRSDSSGSSTDVSPSAHAGLSKSPASKYTPEVSKEKPTDSEKESQPTISEVQGSEAKLADHSSVDHREKSDGNSVLQKSTDKESDVPDCTATNKEKPTASGNDKQNEDIKNNDSEETAVDKQDQPSKNVDDEATMKKDKTAKKRKWGSKSSKTLPAAAKKPTSMEISSDSLKNLIGEVKLSETVFDMETEVVNTLDYDEQEEDRRDVKVKRTVVKNSPPEQDAAETAEARDEEDARKVEASGDAPEQNDKEQEPQKMEDEEQSGDENKEQPVEPKKKIAKPTRSDETVTKESGKKKTVKDGKKVKKKKVVHEETSEAKENKTLIKETVVKEPAKIIATTRPSKPILPVVDEPEKVPGRGEMSPARHPPDRVIRIAGLVRPFTLGQLKELLKRTGELDEEHFWINDIKSHCLAAFKSEQDAVKTRAALHGTRWPQSNPKILIVDFATIEDLLHRKSGGEGPPPSLRKNIEPCIQPEAKEEPKKDKGERDARRRPSAAEQGDKHKEPEKLTWDRERPPPQIREWDKDKMKQFSRSRSKSKDRERNARRSRSRERDQRKRRDGSREKREDEKKKEKRQKEPKAEEEPPAKLLDDLFRKTKATPCIYWLPLTEEQAQQRAIQREEREKEKQKRIAAAEEREKEELKKREAARLERQKQREKERDRSRERERSGGRDRDKSRDRARGGRSDRSKGSRSRSTSRSRRRR